MQVMKCLQRRAFQWPIVWEVCDFSTYQEHATVERFSIFFKNYQVGVEVFSGCGPIENIRISPMNPQKTGACHRLGYFYQKCGKICKFLQWFSAICSWGNVCDFLSRLKKTLGNMGWFLAKKVTLWIRDIFHGMHKPILYTGIQILLYENITNLQTLRRQFCTSEISRFFRNGQNFHISRYFPEIF